MKNLFLLFVCIVMLLVLKERQVKEVMERRDVQHTEVLDFNGTFFLPRTLPFDEGRVNTKRIEISIDGKKYRYVEIQRIHWLVGREADEIRVYRGQTVRTSVPLKLFFMKEVP